MNRRYQYPGDPTEVVILLTGAEFKAQSGPREIRIFVGAGGSDVDRIPVTEVVCDSCNAGIADEEFCALTPGRLYCRDCYEEWIQPYLLAEV